VNVSNGIEGETRSLKRRLAEVEDNLQLIRECMAEHVLRADIKRRCLAEEQRLKKESEELEVRLSSFQAEIDSYIDNPLPRADIDLDQPAQALVKKAIDAWAQANREEALRLCDAAGQCADQTHDRTAAALAQLCQVAMQEQSDDHEKAIEIVKRVKTRFQLSGDKHNSMVAHLLLARLERASENLEQASLEYQQVLALCRELEAESKKTARSGKVLLYGRIIQGIERALEDVDKVIGGRYTRLERTDQIIKAELLGKR